MKQQTLDDLFNANKNKRSNKRSQNIQKVQLIIKKTDQNNNKKIMVGKNMNNIKTKQIKKQDKQSLSEKSSIKNQQPAKPKKGRSKKNIQINQAENQNKSDVNSEGKQSKISKKSLSKNKNNVQQQAQQVLQKQNSIKQQKNKRNRKRKQSGNKNQIIQEKIQIKNQQKEQIKSEQKSKQKQQSAPIKKQMQIQRGRGKGRGRNKGRSYNPLPQVSQDKQLQDVNFNNLQQQKSQIKSQKSQIKSNQIKGQNKQPIEQQIVLKKSRGRKGPNKESNIKPEHQNQQQLKSKLNENQQGMLFTYKLVQNHNDKHQQQINQIDQNQIIDQENKKQENLELPKQQESRENRITIKAISTKGRRRGPNKPKILNLQSQVNVINQNQIIMKKQEKQNSENQNYANFGNVNLKSSQNQPVKKTKKISKNINSKNSNNNNPKKGLEHFKRYYNQLFIQQKIYTETPLIFSKFTQPQEYKGLIKKIQSYQKQNNQNQRRK